MSISKETLLNLKNGDQAAFKVVFDTFYERLHAFSYKYVLDSYAAEEIVENIMLHIWEKRDKLDTINNIKPYLYTSVKNASLDYLKKVKKVIPLNTSHNNISMFDTYVIEEETHSLLINAIDLLPEKCKDVFKRCCIEGHKYKDVAEDLKISVNTVKSQRARAIQILREELKDYPSCIFFINFL
ncbi:RNA polymerase sigma factor [Polaribacter sp. Asnod1-A03]|uniref:RNA polymerase sigma factor n=1 Tax=Polaribacter sp. Asnod1-A03 TaxID=3160581 RepID=UPI00386C71FD